MSIEKPLENYTKFPNCILDNLDKIDNSSFKVLAYMLRQTSGFHRGYHKFAYSYLKTNTGIKGKDTLSKSLKKLIELDLIKKIDESIYQVNWTEPLESPENGQSRNQTTENNLSPEIKPETGNSVQNLDTLKENNIKKEKILKKSDYLNEYEIIDYWKSKNNNNQAEPVKDNKATISNIRATINQYSIDKIKKAIDNLFNDKWSIENKQIRLNRLIKPDKRDQNMFKYGGHSSSDRFDKIKEDMIKMGRIRNEST